jgi:hypothetical protein
MQDPANNGGPGKQPSHCGKEEVREMVQVVWGIYVGCCDEEEVREMVQVMWDIVGHCDEGKAREMAQVVWGINVGHCDEEEVRGMAQVMWGIIILGLWGTLWRTCIIIRLICPAFHM